MLLTVLRWGARGIGFARSIDAGQFRPVEPAWPAFHDHRPRCPFAGAGGDDLGAVPRRRHFEHLSSDFLDGHAHQGRGDLGLLLKLAGQALGGVNGFLERGRIVPHPPGAIFGLPDLRHKIPPVARRANRILLQCSNIFARRKKQGCALPRLCAKRRLRGAPPDRLIGEAGLRQRLKGPGPV